MFNADLHVKLVGGEVVINPKDYPWGNVTHDPHIPKGKLISSSIAYVDNVFKRAAVFDDKNNTYVQISDHPVCESTYAQFTVGVRFKLTRYTSNHRAYIINSNTTGVYSDDNKDHKLTVEVLRNKKITVKVGEDNKRIHTDFVCPRDKTVTLFLTLSKNEIVIYVDDVIIHRQKVNTIKLVLGKYFTLGSRYGSKSYGFSGVIEECWVFPYVLGRRQIQHLSFAPQVHIPLDGDLTAVGGIDKVKDTSQSFKTGGEVTSQHAYFKGSKSEHIAYDTKHALTGHEYTISCFIYKKAHTGEERYPIFVSYGVPYIGCSSASRGIRFSYHERSGKQYSIESSEPMELERWYHVAAVASANGMVLYVDGVEVDSSPHTPLLSDFRGRELIIGNFKADDDRYPVVGGVSDVRVYGKALSHDFIRHLSVCRGSIYSDGVVTLNVPMSDNFVSLATDYLQPTYDDVYAIVPLENNLYPTYSGIDDGAKETSDGPMALATNPQVPNRKTGFVEQKAKEEIVPGVATYFNASGTHRGTNEYVSYYFYVNKGGEYGFDFLVLTIDGVKDSFYVKIDDLDWHTWNTGQYRKWTWKRWKNLTLKKGWHVLSVAPRESGSKFAAIKGVVESGDGKIFASQIKDPYPRTFVSGIERHQMDIQDNVPCLRLNKYDRFHITSDGFFSIIEGGEELEFSYSLFIKDHDTDYGINLFGQEQGNNVYMSISMLGNGQPIIHTYGYTENDDKNHLWMSEFNLKDGKWHHCALTYKYGRLRLYIDGVMKEKVFHIDHAFRANFSVGKAKHGGHGNRNFDGWVSNIKVFKRELTQEEVLFEHSRLKAKLAGTVLVDKSHQLIANQVVKGIY